MNKTTTMRLSAGTKNLLLGCKMALRRKHAKDADLPELVLPMPTTDHAMLYALQLMAKHLGQKPHRLMIEPVLDNDMGAAR